MFHFGANVVATNIVNYIRMNLASFITGRYLGNSELGFFSLANTLSSMTVGRISFIIGRVMFPALSKIQDDNERFKNYYLKTIRAISIISFPLLVGLFVLAKPIVLTVYGENGRVQLFHSRFWPLLVCFGQLALPLVLFFWQKDDLILVSDGIFFMSSRF